MIRTCSSSSSSRESAHGAPNSSTYMLMNNSVKTADFNTFGTRNSGAKTKQMLTKSLTTASNITALAGEIQKAIFNKESSLAFVDASGQGSEGKKMGSVSLQYGYPTHLQISRICSGSNQEREVALAISYARIASVELQLHVLLNFIRLRLIMGSVGGENNWNKRLTVLTIPAMLLV